MGNSWDLLRDARLKLAKNGICVSPVRLNSKAQIEGQNLALEPQHM